MRSPLIGNATSAPDGVSVLSSEGMIDTFQLKRIKHDTNQSCDPGAEHTAYFVLNRLFVTNAMIYTLYETVLNVTLCLALLKLLVHGFLWL